MRDEEYSRPDLMTPFSLSLAAEQAIENAKMKLDEMDSRLLTARSSIARFRSHQEVATPAALDDPRKQNHLATEAASPDKFSGDVWRLREEDRLSHDQTSSRTYGMVEALQITPPRPQRPRASQIPDLPGLEQAYREDLQLELAGTISFADMARAPASLPDETDSADPSLSAVASPTFGHFVLDGEEREPAPDAVRWRNESVVDNLIKPFSVSVGQYRRQDLRTPPPVPSVWRRRANSQPKSPTPLSVPRPTNPLAGSGRSDDERSLSLEEEEELLSLQPQSSKSMLPRPISPEPKSKLVVPSTPKRPLPLITALNSPENWVDPSPVSPSQPARATLASPATATLKRVKSIASPSGTGRSSKVVSPVPPGSGDSTHSEPTKLARPRGQVNHMQPRMLKYTTKPTVESSSPVISSIPRPATKVSPRSGSAASPSAHGSAVTAAVIAMQQHSSAHGGISPTTSPLNSPDSLRFKGFWPGPVTPHKQVSSPLTTPRLDESPQTRLLRERFERALRKLEAPSHSALQVRLAEAQQATMGKHGDDTAARKLEAALRILEDE